MNQFNTNRLLIREIQGQDLAAVFELHSIPEVQQYNTYTLHKSIEDSKIVLEAWLAEQKNMERKEYIFTINLDQKFVGIIALSMASKKKLSLGTVWYLILPDYWGRGIATEALTGLLHFAFKTLKLHRIEAGAAVGNKASYRVLEKVGMKKEGQKRKVLPLANGWSDNFEYAILEEDWL